MSAIASSSTGRVPQGEIIVDFADGGSYLKHKLEESVLEVERRRITREEGKKAQDAMAALEMGEKGGSSRAFEPKSEDVDYIVKQVDVTRQEATSALIEEKGNLINALIRLVKPAPRARSVDGGGEVRS